MGEDIFVTHFKPSTSDTTRYTVVPAVRRRKTMRRRSLLRRLLQEGDDEAGDTDSDEDDNDASAGIECGEGARENHACPTCIRGWGYPGIPESTPIGHARFESLGMNQGTVDK